MEKSLEKFKCLTEKQIDVHTFEFEWKVQRQAAYHLKIQDKNLNSAIFQTNFYNSCWCISLCSNSNCPEHIGIFAYLKESTRDLLALVSFTLKAGSAKDVVKLGTRWHSNPIKGLGYRQWMLKTELEKACYWENNFLTIVCKIDVKLAEEGAVSSKLLPFEQRLPSINQPPLSDSFARLFESEAFADVTFAIQGTKLKAHRPILAARSQYFNAMFSKESAEPIIKISDCEPAIFKSILKYIYTNKIPADIAAVAQNLLLAADRYGLGALARACEHHLCQNISMMTYVKTLKFADLYSRLQIKKHVVNFIQNNYREIVASDMWKKLENENIELAYITIKEVNMR